MELTERERLVSGVLQKLPRKVKALLVLIVIGILYCVAVVTVKSLINGPGLVQICNSDLARQGCTFFSEVPPR
jgi:hypothetical protein